MESDDRLTATIVLALAVVAALVIALAFNDCHETREAHAKCLANPMRSAAECAQAFPERHGQ